jgi:hypothetical protein
MIRLMNSAMMPAEGTYTLRRLEPIIWACRLRAADEQGQLRSYIGYQQTADYIRDLSGIEIPVSREQTTLVDGDELLIVKLAYRVADPALKGQGVDAQSFEFYHATFSAIKD